ncbi:RNA 2',3'-cyclic phosphodiesterase [Vibrio sp. Of7-15]|uniref:RNA 2',3'-cyclic phosphodiesterase n=1 Tax=Vibrio sp. Of7-15 TaxID=2724879 RepID=UPI001EF30354|nr:RNA 2',3'-cyclic phosphodiesterase [Vibrio sp. Of7-15]MCG7499438.1 RNA 2',3'-cyclic phosphodiesterase [Vibrio sp. Of7-15]
MNHSSERLFFALGFEAPLTKEQQHSFTALCQLSEHLDGNGYSVPQGNLHITLAFLGQVTHQQKQLLILKTKEIQHPYIQLQCQSLNYWKQSKVVWLGCDFIPSPLAMLAKDLKEVAIASGLPQESRRYTPHFTLKKNVTTPPSQNQLSDPINFTFTNFGLYCSETVHSKSKSSVQYKCLQQWPLMKPL